MANEKRKIKIIPESYPHDIGEVEITIDEQEIKDYGFITAYKNRLELMIQRIKNNGFHMAVQNNTDYKKINAAACLLFNNYDDMDKQLSIWLIESLQIEIAKIEKQEQKHPIIHTPEYIIKLLDAGKIDEKKNCLCGLETLANYMQMELKIEVNTKLLEQFYNPYTGNQYSKKQIKQAVTAAKWGK